MHLMTELIFFERNLRSGPGTSPDISIVCHKHSINTQDFADECDFGRGGSLAAPTRGAWCSNFAIASSFDFSTYSYVVQLVHLHPPIHQRALLELYKDVVNC